MRKSYNTPKRSCYIRARLTVEEKEAFDYLLEASGMSQTDYIRQAVFHAKVSPHITQECSIDQLTDLLAEYGKIGSNLNQIARHLNSGGTATSYILDDVRTAILDLDDLKYEILKTVGEAYGSH